MLFQSFFSDKILAKIVVFILLDLAGSARNALDPVKLNPVLR